VTSPATQTPSTNILTLSLHDALPIYPGRAGPLGPAEPAVRRQLHPDQARRRPVAHPGGPVGPVGQRRGLSRIARGPGGPLPLTRSEEHTSELQSRENLVCRLLHGKKK